MKNFFKKTCALLLLTTTTLLSFATFADPLEHQALLDYLNAQAGMTATPSQNQYQTGYLRVDITYQQPMDHLNPLAGQFTQRMRLMHKSASTATVLETNGDALDSMYLLFPLASEKQLNQLEVEHRYFGESKPQDLNWSKLTIEQAASDLHRIVKTIRPFYQGKWIATGSYYGGANALYYRYFYPHDVDATLANSAALIKGRMDPIYSGFVSHTGSEQCQQNLDAMQRLLFEQKPQITAYMFNLRWWTATFNKVGYDVAYDRAVAEHKFTFLQNSTLAQCEALNVTNPAVRDLASQMFSTIYRYDDVGFDHYEAAHYLAYTQLGYPKLDTDNIKEYLTSDPNQFTNLFVASPTVNFDNIISRIEKWAKYHANTIMVVYGENDPWSASQFVLRQTEHGDNHRFIVPNGNGYDTLFSLTGEARDNAEAVLARWLDLPAAL